ncbi:MAG: YegP family protein, partial [Actinomycetota bacterium]|nr:YegP family protein [Actinomycetota bacterium]
ALNDSLLGGWRTRAMCTVPGDDQLLAGALAWVARHGGRDRAISRRGRDAEPQPLFRGLSMPITEPDEAFAAHGLLRPVTSPSGKSQPPDLLAPINIAFRLRQLLGVTARAEVVRTLLTMDVQRVSAAVVARAAGYHQRNVGEVLASLQSAGVVSVTGVGSELYYSLDRARWAAFLGTTQRALPSQRDWPQLLAALRRILRWLSDPKLDELSDYLRASAARDLLEEVHPDLTYAGIPVDFGRTVDDAWAGLERTLERGLGALGAPATRTRAAGGAGFAAASDGPPARGALDVYRDRSGSFRWRLRGGNGQVVAVSPEAFTSAHSAKNAARHFADRATELDADVYRDAAGGYRWRVRGNDGRLVASSSDAFSTRSNARRAVEGAFRAVRSALRS